MGELNDTVAGDAADAGVLLRTEPDLTEVSPPGTANPAANADPVPNKHATETADDRISDYPSPPTLSGGPDFTWNEDISLVTNIVALGCKLAASGDLYRASRYASGLILGSKNPLIPPTFITTARQLAAIIVDRVHVKVMKNGKPRGSTIPGKYLDVLLHVESFLQQFDPIDEIITTPQYLGADFRLCAPGYNNGGPGQRVLYVGPPPAIADSLDATMRFLNVMEFETSADRTNALAAKLIFTLRNYWLGGKPIFPITASKSQAGKETIVSFIAGANPKESVSFQWTNWAFERAVISALKNNPAITLINVENARLERRQSSIASAFLERFVTDPEPLLHSVGTGPDVHRKNNLIITITTNQGVLGEDLLNRGIPIHLSPKGDVAARVSVIGNPKWEYLPKYHAQINAEIRSMIEKWKQADCPRDLTVKHPFSECAQVVGGILKVNGFTDFLGNYGLRKTIQDPIRQGLGILAASDFARQDGKDKKRHTATEWVAEVVRLGLVGRLIPEGDRENEEAYARGLGLTFSNHVGEAFTHEVDGKQMTMRLHKRRGRVGNKSPTLYWFADPSTNDQEGHEKHDVTTTQGE